MKLATLIALLPVLLAGCATTPLEKRQDAIVECTKTFMEYEANVTEASNACIHIYRKKRTAYVPNSIQRAGSQEGNAPISPRTW